MSTLATLLLVPGFLTSVMTLATRWVPQFKKGVSTKMERRKEKMAAGFFLLLLFMKACRTTYIYLASAKLWVYLELSN